MCNQPTIPPKLTWSNPTRQIELGFRLGGLDWAKIGNWANFSNNIISSYGFKTIFFTRDGNPSPTRGYPARPKWVGFYPVRLKIGSSMGLKQKTRSGFGSGPDFGKNPTRTRTRPDPFKLKIKLLKYLPIYIVLIENPKSLTLFSFLWTSLNSSRLSLSEALMSLSALTSFSLKPSHIVSPNHPHPHSHSLIDPPSPSLSSRGGWYLPRRSTEVRSERKVRGLGRDIDGWNRRHPTAQALTAGPIILHPSKLSLTLNHSSPASLRSVTNHNQTIKHLAHYRSTIDVVWDFFFSYFCKQNLGLGFFFCEPNLLGFLGVLLLGFSDLLILFLGFVEFFVQIGLLDLGIRLDSKKIEWLPRKLHYILRFVILGLYRFLGLWFWARAHGARRGRFGPWEKNPFNKRVGSGPRVLAHRSGPGMKKPDLNSIRCHSYFLSL